MKNSILSLTVVLSLSLFSLGASATQSLDLSQNLKSAVVDIDPSGNGEVDVLIPAGDKVNVRLVKSDVDQGCQFIGQSNGGMARTVSLKIGDGTQSESCTFKISEDGKSANVTLEYSVSDD